MEFRDAVRTCWKKYGDFDGRAARSEFWWWVLFMTIVSFIAAIVAVLLVTVIVVLDRPGLWWIATMIFMVVVLAFILPTIAVSVRRLHDRDLSGWWYLLSLSGIGSIVLLVWYALPGTPGPNRYDS